jgi:hypothetical protein
MDEIVQTVYSRDRKNRIHIVRRSNGTCGYEEEYFSEDEYEMCWIPVGQRPFCVCDSPETALREARGRVIWLIHEAREANA